MSKVNQLIMERKKKRQAKRRPLTPTERRRKVKNWTTFYRRNWNIYAKYELGINLKFFQEIAIYLMGTAQCFFLMCGRGLSKSFMSGLGGVIICMLYPYSEVVLTATTIKTAKKMVKEKIENEICGRFSPKLKWLKDNGYITFKYDQEEVIVNFTFNGSWIKILPETDSSRGERASGLVFEECRLMKKSMVDSVFLPMRHARVPKYRLLPEYENDPRLIERARIIYLTSTRYKHEWFFRQWKICVNNTFNQEDAPRLQYAIMCGDVETSIKHGFMTREDLDIARQGSSDMDIMMEYYNIPQGEIEGSFYALEMFHRNRVIDVGFTPPTTEEWVFDYLRGTVPYFREKLEDELRVIYVDFAFTDTVNKNQVSDNTVIGCMSGYPDEDRNKYLRNAEYMETYSGGKKDESVLRIRELFYLYDADYVIVDIRNGGEDRIIDLTKPYYHDGFGFQMNGMGICTDAVTEFYCDKAKVENLRGRVVDENAIPVIIPVVGTDERNNNYHIAMKNALLNSSIRFLVDETTKRQELEEDERYLKMDSKQRMRTLLGHVQLDIMIVEEAIKLQQVIKRGFISLITVGGNKRDRIVACEYANYFFNLKELEMIAEQTSNSYTEDDWQVWG